MPASKREERRSVRVEVCKGETRRAKRATGDEQREQDAEIVRTWGAAVLRFNEEEKGETQEHSQEWLCHKRPRGTQERCHESQRYKGQKRQAA
jgi:hypothetical protein